MCRTLTFRVGGTTKRRVYLYSIKHLRHYSTRCDGQDSGTGTLTRWLRELRPAAATKPSPTLDRSHAAYHSEGKGLRRRKDRDRRRHSFNEQQAATAPKR